jgi:hypothetical protein
MSGKDEPRDPGSVGRHKSRWSPSGWNQQSRFLVAIVGIVALAFLALTIAALLLPGD